ncbi:MAG: GGDEF domain-containing protein [Nitratireductor sp.]|nr:GGDEF domain-containing protein [Nitratireductor sp.]
MARKTHSARLDLFVVADAVLISLACLLIFMAYREINAAPVRHAQVVAQTLLGVGDDFANEDVLSGMRLGNDGQAELARRLNSERQEIHAVHPGAQVGIYSTHPDYTRLSEPGDSFYENALHQLREGSLISGQLVRDGSFSFFRAAAPLLAAKDCFDCAERGVETYKRGDVVGLREVKVPIGNEYARIIGKLLYAFATLAIALACVLGIIFPMLRRVRVERANMNDLAETLEMQAVTDALTGLFNRRYFEQALQRYLDEFNEVGSALGLLIFDLDHFKQINDAHGHDAGDMVLKEVALRLKAITRENDVVARIGGEEFAVITPFVGREQLMVVAERYREMIGSLKIDVGDVILRPTISVGVATNDGGGGEAQDLFKAADTKLYEAKRNGRNRVAA